MKSTGMFAKWLQIYYFTSKFKKKSEEIENPYKK